MLTLQWRHNGRDSVSNHQHHDCFLNRLFRHRSKKNQSSASLAFVRGIHRRPVNSPHKGPVTRKIFPFDDVIIMNWFIWMTSEAVLCVTPYRQSISGAMLVYLIISYDFITHVILRAASLAWNNNCPSAGEVTMNMCGNNDLNNTISYSTQTKMTLYFMLFIISIQGSETTRQIINPLAIYIHLQLVASQHIVIIMHYWFRPNEVICWDHKPEKKCYVLNRWLFLSDTAQFQYLWK